LLIKPKVHYQSPESQKIPGVHPGFGIRWCNLCEECQDCLDLSWFKTVGEPMEDPVVWVNTMAITAIILIAIIIRKSIA